MLYSHNGGYPKELPERIRLSNGVTRTDSSSYTEDEILDAGYVSAEDAPVIEPLIQKLSWSGTAWEVLDLTEEEIRVTRHITEDEVRGDRNNFINYTIWRIDRYLGELRMGVTPTDDISLVDKYIQELRDVPTQGGFPYEVEWPTPEFDIADDDVTAN